MMIPYSPPVFIVAGKAIIVTVFVIASLAFPEGCSGFTTLTRLSRSSSIKHNIGGILLNTKCHRTTASSSLLFAGTDDDDDDDNEGEEEKDDTAGTQTQTVVQDLMLSSSGTEAHALEVFSKYASKGIYEGQKFITKFEHLFEILCCLDIEATEDDAEIVFKYLDEDGDGRLLFNNEFYPWYINAYDAAAEVAESFQSLLVGRRSIDEFDETQVDDDVVYRAIQCAIAAPNRDCTEPWRFICVGSQTVSKFAALNEKLTHADAEEGEFSTNYKLYGDWTKIAPGWCVVTAKLRSNDGDGDNSSSDSDSDIDLPSMVDQEDYKSVCCAIQNFMLSMWSEGIGTKWTSGPVQKTKEFADLCGADLNKERVVGIIWYGYATGGAKYADPRRRLLSVEDVLTTLP